MAGRPERWLLGWPGCTTDVAPLTAFVDAMRAATGVGARVPYFDPLDGGVDAECLVVLEAPGGGGGGARGGEHGARAVTPC